MQVLDQLADAPANGDVPLASESIHSPDEHEAERLLANLAHLSDEQVNSLLIDMLGDSNPLSAHPNGGDSYREQNVADSR